jgi:hypothetical protein
MTKDTAICQSKTFIKPYEKKSGYDESDYSFNQGNVIYAFYDSNGKHGQ